MIYDHKTHRGWSVVDVARGQLIKRVSCIDTDAKTITLFDDPPQIDRAKQDVVTHKFSYDNLCSDITAKTFHITMSIGPCDPTSGKSWHEWLKGDKAKDDPPTQPPSTLSMGNINKPSPKPHPAPGGIERTKGQPPVAPPKGRE
jgi:hypothetical protein